MRRQEALAHACDAVVHSGDGSVRTFSGRALGVLLTDQTSVRLDQSGGLGGSHACLASGLLREVTRTQFMRGSTHTGERWRNCCNVWGCRRRTIVSRTAFGLSRDRDQRNRCRPQEPGHSLSNSSNIHPTLAGSAAATLSFVDPSRSRIEKCDGVQATCTLSTSGSADAGPHSNAMQSCPVSIGSAGCFS